VNVPYRQDLSGALLVPRRALPTYVFAGTCDAESIFHTWDIEHMSLSFESVLLQYVGRWGLTTPLVGIEVTNITKFLSTFVTLEWERRVYRVPVLRMLSYMFCANRAENKFVKLLGRDRLCIPH
jgi:hypothetical protein